ncbi:PaaI family thioesterase [Nocardia gipuzkoensis]|uniref:PaaI family thioesterase n=1 Tax=Nocardia gipuzkoensis TaxID=2749991 RepID=UPI001E61B385|nr:hotdog domain-containing protein [Nocardia gipuzkoensis]UGT67054.1 PaaI family thioesterase [Nocardia gipuzkoensis]
MTIVPSSLEERGRILRELGFATRRVGEELHGRAEITPEMHVPGTTVLRTSVLATWADTVSGLLASLVMGPRVPVTLELDVGLYRPAPGTGEVRAVGRTVKVGRSVFVAEFEFSVEAEPIAFGAASFMVAPDPDVQLPPQLSVELPATAERLPMPLAERARCERVAPGTVVLPRSMQGLNASDTINGGLIALAAEEAVLSLAPGGTLSSLGLRYLLGARVGPVVAQARLHEGLGRVELRDSGNANRLTTLATARTFGG